MDKICKIKKKDSRNSRWQIQFRIIQKNGVPPYVWMSPVHTQHKESIILRGFPYAPIHLDAHICLDAPHMSECPCMFGCSLCLNVPCMFGQPLCLDAPIYLDDVSLPPVHTQHKERILCQTKEVSTCPDTSACPLYINNIKKESFVRLRGCPYAPLDLDATICLDTTCMLGCHLYV